MEVKHAGKKRGAAPETQESASGKRVVRPPKTICFETPGVVPLMCSFLDLRDLLVFARRCSKYINSRTDDPRVGMMTSGAPWGVGSTDAFTKIVRPFIEARVNDFAMSPRPGEPDAPAPEKIDPKEMHACMLKHMWKCDDAVARKTYFSTWTSPYDVCNPALAWPATSVVSPTTNALRLTMYQQRIVASMMTASAAPAPLSANSMEAHFRRLFLRLYLRAVSFHAVGLYNIISPFNIILTPQVLVDLRTGQLAWIDLLCYLRTAVCLAPACLTDFGSRTGFHPTYGLVHTNHTRGLHTDSVCISCGRNVCGNCFDHGRTMISAECVLHPRATCCVRCIRTCQTCGEPVCAHPECANLFVSRGHCGCAGFNMPAVRNRHVRSKMGGLYAGTATVHRNESEGKVDFFNEARAIARRDIKTIIAARTGELD